MQLCCAESRRNRKAAYAGTVRAGCRGTMPRRRFPRGFALILSVASAAVSAVGLAVAYFLINTNLLINGDAFSVFPRVPEARVTLQESRGWQPAGVAVAGTTKSANASSVVAIGFLGFLAAATCIMRRRSLRGAFARERSCANNAAFHAATVKANAKAADGLRLITVEVSKDVIGTFRKPGQFVQARAAAHDKPSFYAISNPPNAMGGFEMLIKDVESNRWLTNMAAGNALELSNAMGPGFTFSGEAWVGSAKQVCLFATGSGIAPMRSVIESQLLDGCVARLYFGAHHEGALAFVDRFDEWKRRGVEVIPVLSRADDGWTGRRGYVQDAFREDEERGEGFVLASQHVALLCGQKEMVAAVREHYAGLGVPEERTLLSF
eukprot:TRINITY_DN5159_c0_g2_i1.p1 TRINITY_DN5159_c0_g2~~TRINITY_DN5159_c0_g2_i1.p1  ORF type:complete len:379 (+),score=51.05 TRINITY_DN5159_c0_g2_i1:100-1236(+)